MRKAWRACLACWLADACQASAGFDAEALVQQDLRFSQAPGKVRISPKTVVKQVITHLSTQLDDYVEKHEEDLNKTRSMLQFARKYASRASSKPTILADLTNEADAEVATMLIGFLREPAFFKAASTGMKNMVKTLSTFSLRTEKRVSDLILASETALPGELPRHVDTFFAKEVHIVEDVIKAFFDDVVAMMRVAPGYEAVVGDVMTPLVAKMRASASVRLGALLHSYVDSKGSSFCEKPLFEFTKEYIPALAEVKDKIPLLEAFVQMRAPDVAPKASELLQTFGQMTSNLAKRLRDDIRITAQKVCGILGLPVATTAEPVAMDEAAPTPATVEDTTPPPAAVAMEAQTTPPPAAADEEQLS